MTIAIILFAIFLFAGLPIGFVMIISALAGVISFGGLPFVQILPNKFYAGISAYILISVPYFVLTAELMNRSKLTGLLINFSNSLFGRIPGALSHVNVAVSTLFAGITGAAVTDAIAVGKILIPEMKKEGYHADYSAAITASAAIIGPIIPPSVIMIVYAATLQNVTVIKLFAAGLIPGLLMALLLLLISVWRSVQRGYIGHEKIVLRKIVLTGAKSLPAFSVPVVIVGGILSGLATVTEASVLGAFITIVLGTLVYRSLGWSAIWESIKETITFSGVVFLLLGAATMLGWYVTRSGLTAYVATLIAGISSNVTIEILVVDLVLVIIGMFIDVVPAIVVAAPILAPPLIHIGLSPLHVAIAMLLALNLGNITPPVGMTLMTTSKISGVPYESAIKEVIPFFLSQIIVVVVISIFPEIILWFPHLIGL
jgi:tripartite ATP-independent transporter DctM subunit